MMIDTTLGTARAGIALGSIAPRTTALGSIALGGGTSGGIAAGARRQPVGCVRGRLGLDRSV